MNQDEIDAMPAGTYMDELIATEIMKWHKGVWFDHVWFNNEGEMTDYSPYETADFTHFNPSVNIKLAWDVIAMKYIRTGCAAWMEGDGHTGYRAGFTSGDLRYESDGDDPAHALCRAELTKHYEVLELHRSIEKFNKGE
jgi:hypothetical protein